MKRALWIYILAIPAGAHVVSMSSGDLIVDGARARYQLRMPLYEAAHTQAPERTLLQHISFAGAKLVSSSCHPDAGRDLFVCDAEYQFAAPVERIDVECAFPAVTVPNHVHLLRAEMAGKHDQAVFDVTFQRATLRFRPPTPAEIAATEAASGIARALGGVVQIVFLAALALAARSRRELLAIVGMFLAGQALSVILVPHTAWQPAPRFVEAAAALAVAYLAVEILLLPAAGARWLIAGVLGAFHGLYFHLFLQTTGYHAGWVLSGAAAAEAAAIVLLAFIFAQIGRAARALRPLQVSASALLVFGMVWFALRLRG